MRVWCQQWGRRFIPTHVGNTTQRRTRWIRPAVHPHTCGEHGGAAGEMPEEGGSSPHMWGTHALAVPASSGDRFIPTHVGNTYPHCEERGFAAVHPHTCGEHPGEAAKQLGHSGSSPHMWGTLVDLHVWSVMFRFIPTHVGNTSAGASRALAFTVHPHTCGEHLLICITVPGWTGSSPHMWGTR